jgi:DNA polymerase-3 subunit gamma/tau
MSFADLIGQEHVSRTLLNAIKQNRVAHAFLFTGVRGVGKTTSARILAKALNCLSSDPSQASPEPCLKCAACLEIAEGTDMDVREIDGASYNGVDEIRKLQDSLPYRPARDRFKIFIVDEVHMLSQNAWNALLKTLEEPPPHVKFIFATTEVNKVPVTILSRVQRYDFKMIPSRLIASRIRHVLAAESIEADDSAVAVVAREAAGSMRDALSLLDQVIAFSPERLVGEDTARVLGVAGYSALHLIARAVIAAQPADALAHVARLVDQSVEPAVLARDLMNLLRDLVVARLASGADELLDLPEDEKREVLELAKSAEQIDLLRLQQGFAKSFDEIARAAQPRAALEMLLVRLSLRPPLIPIDDLVARLSRLEGRLGNGGPSPASGSPPPRRSEGEGRGPAGRPGPPPRTAPSAAPPPNQPEASTAQSTANVAGASLNGTPSKPAPPSSPTSNSPASSTPAPSLSFPPPSAVAPAPPSAAAPPPPSAAAPPPPSAAAPPPPSAVAPPSSLGPPTLPSPSVRPPPSSSEPKLPPSAPVPPSAPPPSSALSPTLADWRTILSHLGDARPDITAVLQHAAPKRVDVERIVIGYASGSALDAVARSDESLKLLREAAVRHWGKAPSISFEAADPGAATLADAEKRLRDEQRRAAIDRAQHHPSVQTAVEILGARIKQVQLGEH